MKSLLFVEHVLVCQMVLLAAWFDILMLQFDALFFRRASFECTDGPKPFASGIMFSFFPPRQTVMGKWILCAVNEFGQCLEPSSSRYLGEYIWCLCDKMCGEGEICVVSSHGAWVKATEYRDARNFLMEWVIAHSLKS